MSNTLSQALPIFRSRSCRPFLVSNCFRTDRFLSSSTYLPPQVDHGKSFLPQGTTTTRSPANPVAAPSLFSRLTTWHLMRNIMLSTFLTQPLLLKPGLAFMKMVAEAKSPLLNPDRNPLLKAILKPVVYNHFCAGADASEVKRTIKNIKRLGFTGVVLVYNKEIQLSSNNEFLGAQTAKNVEIEAWRDSTLETLDLVESGDWIGMKYVNLHSPQPSINSELTMAVIGSNRFTGAGQDVTQALVNRTAPPPAFVKAMDVICEKAKAKGCRMWIDAEQQAVQGGIDDFTIGLMRRHNVDGTVLVYTTIQAYLKAARPKLASQLKLASQEGWVLAVKLVRGAYMANDTRSLIHDTKADTDNSYNGIVHDLLTGTFENMPVTKDNMRLVLAGHNSETVRSTLVLADHLAGRNSLHVCPDFAQLQGMADDVGCEIIQFGETTAQAEKTKTAVTANKSNDDDGACQTFIPQAFKCLHWGSVQVSMQYLVRRAIENSAAVSRMKDNAAASRKELLRRLRLVSR